MFSSVAAIVYYTRVYSDPAPVGQEGSGLSGQGGGGGGGKSAGR